MKILGYVLVAMLCIETSSIANAQTLLRPTTTLTDTVASNSMNQYVLTLEDEAFVYLEVHQTGLDVVVEVVDPNGQSVGVFDRTAADIEPVSFIGAIRGTYRITVSPYGDGAGSYGLSMRRVEPVATQLRDRVRQILAEVDEDDRPGAVVAVVTPDGEWVESFGMANLATSRPLSERTLLNVGSVSKTLTAFGALLLAERGTLELDTDVRSYKPELPAFGSPVTVRDLLSHTSGYREIYDILLLAGWKYGDLVFQQDGYAILQEQRVPQDPPGTVFRYNNTGYMVLADLVAEASGLAFDEWLSQEVMSPAGMTGAVVKTHPTQTISGAAESYTPDPRGGWRALPHRDGTYGSGAVYASGLDLLAWSRVLLGANADPTWSRVVGRMTTPHLLATGDTSAYGLGIYSSRVDGRIRYRHTGSDAGYRAVIDVYPEEQVAIAVASNSAAFRLGFVQEITEAVLGSSPASHSQPSAPATAPPPVQPDAPVPPDLATLVGQYWSPELGLVYSIELREGRLQLSHPRLGSLDLEFEGGTVFSSQRPLEQLAIEYDTEGRVLGFHVEGRRTRGIHFILLPRHTRRE